MLRAFLLCYDSLCALSDLPNTCKNMSLSHLLLATNVSKVVNLMWVMCISRCLFITCLFLSDLYFFQWQDNLHRKMWALY